MHDLPEEPGVIPDVDLAAEDLIDPVTMSPGLGAPELTALDVHPALLYDGGLDPLTLQWGEASLLELVLLGAPLASALLHCAQKVDGWHIDGEVLRVRDESVNVARGLHTDPHHDGERAEHVEHTDGRDIPILFLVSRGHQQDWCWGEMGYRVEHIQIYLIRIVFHADTLRCLGFN
jgi:hypothetical protein